MEVNRVKKIIPRYCVGVGERVNKPYTQIMPSFEVIGMIFAWLRKVENGPESYWNATVGPITCCFPEMFAVSDRQFDTDRGFFNYLLGNVQRIDWDKKKGKMTIESSNFPLKVKVELRKFVSF